MDDKPTAFDYMTGSCHVFALAAQALTGWPMRAVMVVGEPDGEDVLPGRNDIIHVYLLDPEGRRFDAYGTGTSGGEYEIEKENDLGETLATEDCDADLIATMVRAGWLSPFDDAEVEVAKELAAEVHAEEYEAFPPAP